MTSKKVIRYYSDCGKGFWTKKGALNHESYCRCWKNPKLQCCLSCKHKNIRRDSNGMENEPMNLESWEANFCKHSDSGVPVHEKFENIRKYCKHYEKK